MSFSSKKTVQWPSPCLRDALQHFFYYHHSDHMRQAGICFYPMLNFENGEKVSEVRSSTWATQWGEWRQTQTFWFLLLGSFGVGLGDL